MLNMQNTYRVNLRMICFRKLRYNEEVVILLPIDQLASNTSVSVKSHLRKHSTSSDFSTFFTRLRLPGLLQERKVFPLTELNTIHPTVITLPMRLEPTPLTERLASNTNFLNLKILRSDLILRISSNDFL